jgi:hypothetical protein
MAVDVVVGAPWTRKHDDPRTKLIPAAPRIAYPKSLEDLIELCRDESFGSLKAAGSHWALSPAAVSTETFIETHDYWNVRQAMARVPQLMGT